MSHRFESGDRGDACVLYFCICTCSAQLSMFHIERRSRNTLILLLLLLLIIIMKSLVWLERGKRVSIPGPTAVEEDSLPRGPRGGGSGAMIISTCSGRVTVSMSAFLACHQCYCEGSSLAWGLNLQAIV